MEEDLVPWSSIKGGHKGFETLANEYVANEFCLQTKWKPTKKTRDGNKDGYAIVYCYLPLSGKREEQVWMEAKYSTKRESIDRYKLDSTIVSAIIEKNVKEIIFVTNVDIKLAVIRSVKKALINALDFAEDNVSFCTKHILENWILTRPNVYRSYFQRDPKIPDDFFQNPFCPDRIQFFENHGRIQFSEPLRELRTNFTYTTLLRIFAPEDSYFRISSICEYMIINNNRYVGDGRIHLEKGSNLIELSCQFERETYINGELIKIGGNLKIKCHPPVTILREQYNPIVINESQTNARQFLEKNISSNSINNHFSCHCVTGGAGMGKTYLFEKLSDFTSNTNQDLIYEVFTDDQIYNSQILLDVLLSILFYYLDVSQIDEHYLREIRKQGSFVSTYLERLVSLRDNPDLLCNEFENYQLENSVLLPENLSLNTKIIILDDAHKLDSNNSTFLNQMVCELNNCSISGAVIIGARDGYYKRSEFQIIRQNCVFTMHELELTTPDVINSIKSNGFSIPELALTVIISNHSLNCLLLIELLRYMSSQEKEIDEAEIVLLYQNFTQSEIFKKTILQTFNLAYQKDQNRVILDAVYLSNAGIHSSSIEENHRASLVELIDSKLVKYTATGKIVPFHDLYRITFNEHFRDGFLKWFSESNYLLSEKETMKYALLSSFSADSYSPDKILRELQLMNENHHFYSIIYVLEELFYQKSSSQIHKDRLGEGIFYNLFYIYTRALGHTSSHISGSDFKLRIISETIHSENPELLIVCARTLAEVINDSYEDLQIDAVIENSKKLEQILHRLYTEGYLKVKTVEHDESYILMIEVLMLTALLLDDYEKGEGYLSTLTRICKDIQDPGRLATIRIRFARSIMHQDPNKAISILKEAIQQRIEIFDNPDEKWALIGGVELSFIEIQFGLSKLVNLRDIHYKLKQNLLNDYRRSKNTIIGAYLVKRDNEKALKLLTEDSQIIRKCNNRYKGIRFQLYGALEFLRGDKEKSLQNLESQKETFSHLGDSYKTIIEHNIKLLKTSIISKKISFRFDPTLHDDVFYIDPRLW